MIGVAIVGVLGVLAYLGIKHAPKVAAVAAAVVGACLTAYWLYGRNKKIETVDKGETKAADAYRDLGATTSRQRRIRYAENRKARAAIEEIRHEYDRRVDDRDQHVADLWNKAFGREPAARTEDKHAGDAAGADGGGDGAAEDQEDPDADLPEGPRRVRTGVNRLHRRARSLGSYRN